MNLEAHGITGKVVKSIEKLLSGRKQRVCINGKFSDWKPVTSGVPQGSVLRPVLFLIFINDLDAKILSKILKFADDTKLFGNANMAAIREFKQKDLDSLFKWSEIWQMSFNIDKCKVMHLGSRNCRHVYQLDRKDLGVVDEKKDSGVIISANLKPSGQCRVVYKYNKAIKILGMINRIIEFKNRNILICLYKFLVRLLLEYAVGVCGTGLVSGHLIT